MEKFKTERSYKVFCEGNINVMSKNPLNPSKIFGYNPFLATAFDVSVPNEEGAMGKMRLWHVGELHDTECKGVEIGPDDKQLSAAQVSQKRISSLMSQHRSTKPDPDDKFLFLREDDANVLQQQYLLAFCTVKDILEEFMLSQKGKESVDFGKLDVEIVDSDPFLISMLSTELLRVLIDMHYVDFYDAAKIVSKVIKYRPKADRD
jgi:glucan phosphorylase